MEIPATIHVQSGTGRVASSPAELRTIVGPGFAVGLRSRLGTAGGLLHLQPHPRSNDPHTESFDESHIMTTLDAFVGELMTVSEDVGGCAAEIVGGADILKIQSHQERETSVHRCVHLISSHLKSRGISTRSRANAIGGTHGHTVRLTLNQSLDSCRILEIRRTGDSSGKVRPSVELRTPTTPAPATGIKTVNAGQLAIGQSPSQFVAVLGSCVGVAICDMQSRIGGLAHVMIPESNGYVHNPARYADTAVGALVAAIKSVGGRRERMKARLAGGANVLMIGDTAHHFRIGERNAGIVKHHLNSLKIPIIEEDLGGVNGRKMLVALRNFDMKIKVLRSVQS